MVAYEAIGTDPKETVCFDDKLPNLEKPHQLGMRTVYIGRLGGREEYVDYSFHSFDDALMFLFPETLRK